VLLAAMVGCSDTAKTSKKVIDSLNDSRRLYQQASALLSNPPYTDASGNVVIVTDVKLTATSLPEQVTPAENAEALKLLEAALAKFNELGGDLQNVPASLKSDALLLKGQIQLARGRYFAASALRFAEQGWPDRLAVRVLVAQVGANESLSGFANTLSSGTLETVKQLQQQAQNELAALEKETAAKDVRIAALGKDNEALVKTNDDLSKQIQEKRKANLTASGEAGVALLKEVKDLERAMDANSAKIAANQSAIDALEADKAVKAPLLASINSRITDAQDALQSSTSQKAAMAETGQKYSQAATEVFAQLKEPVNPVNKVVENCRKARGQEEQAIEALTQAVEVLKQAQAEADQAFRSAQEIAKALPPGKEDTAKKMREAAEQHLVTVLALKSDASLWLGKLNSQRIALSDEIVPLGTSLAEVAKGLGQEDTYSALILGCAVDTAKAKNEAVERFRAAQNDLEKITSTYLRSGEGANTLWIYQGMLADAYLGEYLLTRSQEVRAKAQQFLVQALANREYSPYVSTLVRLQQVLVQPSASQPASEPAGE
jgi:hypothetical protein